MARDHRKLQVFEIAHKLAVCAYRVTRELPAEERYGLQSQIRRSAVSVPTNIVEGCARGSTAEYLNFMRIALASASECRYLLELAQELEFLNSEEIVREYGILVRSIQALITGIERLESP